ncbi:Signal transduction histidine kinase [Streptomyces sp. 2224.1]|nr:signal transduction histidine kinase [Streptomyces sp. 2321.6]SDR52332.1 Signal transduction histidine kinase [Streptomyces sp. KS_16]SEC37058.1 Signal transduction histidine kinase [Streptomyces sp. 2133.1]SEC66241.1 Signal transduction histidine kinase [Streptomyces sp. 2224.1]SEF03725.1 Signal transduction histidine kinase [Streptomyces sp. 2112.3]SNC66964.1 Signal transduction histidine kinase [Streptomyces sp. 2114.4]
MTVTGTDTGTGTAGAAAMAARRHGKRPPKVLRMSVELPLWRALTGYRILTLVYTLCLVALSYRQYAHPLGAAAYMGALTVWTALTWQRTTSAERCTRHFLVADLGFAIGGILLTLVVDTHARIMGGGPTLPSIWTAGAVLGFAIKGGWRWAAVASTIVAVANLVERQELARDTIHNVVLVWVASVGLGYVVEVARSSERTLARALQIEAATRERERLARDIHDSVLQVLAMVQRRGAEIGGEASELGRMAGEQEVALRTLVAGGLVPPPALRALVPHQAGERAEEPAAASAVAVPAPPGDGPCDVRALLAPYAGAGVTFSEPGAPVALPPAAAAELAAAVSATLDNVRVHAGAKAHAWILVEDEPHAVIVTVRDDGPGIPEGRLADAEREGRLGVALSIRGRLRDLGGSAEWISVPGQGTEVELTVPKGAAPEGGKRGKGGA